MPSQIKFVAYGPKQGPLHNLPISTPYLTKDYLQQKRFQAQSNGTTYAYDLPDMFRQMAERQWKEYSKARQSIDIRIPEKILLECVELVLDGEILKEEQRLPGENDVSEVRNPFRNPCLTNFVLFSAEWSHGESSWRRQNTPTDVNSS